MMILICLLGVNGRDEELRTFPFGPKFRFLPDLQALSTGLAPGSKGCILESLDWVRGGGSKKEIKIKIYTKHEI